MSRPIRFAFHFVALFSLAIGARPAHPEVSAPPAGPVIAITEVSVVPMHRPGVVPSQTVLIAGDRILRLGDSADVEVPADAIRIDGRGRYLMPALADLHVHLRDASEADLRAYLEAGVTTVREMNGREHLLTWRRRIEAGSLLGPRMFVASPTIGNWSSPREGFPTPETAAEAHARVQRFKNEGYDFIKVYSFVPAPIYRAILSAAAEVDIPVVGHVPLEIPLEEALALGQTSIEHLHPYVDAAMTPAARELDSKDMRAVFHAVDLDATALRELAAATREAGVWNCPTVTFFDRVLPVDFVKEPWGRPELRRLGAATRRQIVRALHDAGAPMILGTDSDAGDDLAPGVIHEEIANLVAAGLDPFEVLEMATTHAASFLGLEKSGAVASGFRADLILLECNPLERTDCLRRPVEVLARGHRVLLRPATAETDAVAP